MLEQDKVPTRRRKASLAPGLALLLLFVSLAAGAAPVFGPESFQRAAGSPRTETRSFAATRPDAIYRLVVYNGGLEGVAVGDPVTAGSIDLNGQQLVGPSEFGRHRGSFSVPVQLESYNQLDVQIRGKPGSMVVLVIEPEGNVAPVADAGPDQSVFVGDVAVLDASGSTDLNGDPLSFTWTFADRPEGSTAALDAPEALGPSFDVDAPGDYRIALTVSDGELESEPDEVVVSTRNSAPVADAGPDRSAFVTDTVLLDGSRSYDVDGDPLDFSWALLDRPDGSAAALSDPASVEPSFQIDLPGHYLAELVVGDGALTSAPDQVLVATDNSAPTADAGPDLQAWVGQEVVLDGNGSFDVDGDPLTWSWSLTVAPAGSAAALIDADARVARFVPDLAGTYVGQLVVTDGALTGEPDTAKVEAADPNRPPQILSEPQTTTTVGSEYRYQVVADDPDGDSLSFELAEGPVGMASDSTTGVLTWTPQGSDQGGHEVRILVTDTAAAAAEQSYTLLVEPPPNLPPRITSYPLTEVFQGETYNYRLAASDPEGDSVHFALEQGPPGMAIDPDSGLIGWTPEGPGDYAVRVIATDSAANEAQQGFTLTVLAETIPTDPGEEPPPLAPDFGGAFIDDIRFLFDGPGALQSGLQPGALEQKRVAVLRGRVLARGGAPLAGVSIAVQGAPELGHTVSRADGWFDLVVNGGGELTVRYAKPGWLPVQRVLVVPTEDYAVLPEVFLTRLDPQATLIALGAAVTDTQIAQGSLSDDGDGARSATVLIPAGTTATYTRADGSTASLDQMTLRATEYTVGPDGPRAMPGMLPAASGYTYAVELSADEVLADGVKVAGKDVLLNQPVSVYVDNFIGFPVGGVVPVGYYDNDAARWVAADNGLVTKLLGVADGLALLDLDGSGTPAGPAALGAAGIDDAERASLASAYAPGAELWRFRTAHLSTWDCNWPYGPPDDAEPPPPLECEGGGPGASGSDIRIGAGTLSERVAIPGANQSLVFNSARRSSARGRQPLSNGPVHPKLKRVEYQISVAGQVLSGSATPVANASVRFAWNGRDAYGRTVQGPVTARARVSNVYEPVLYTPARVRQVFASFLNLAADPQSRGANAIALTGSRARFEIALTSESTLTIGGARAVDAASTLGSGELNLSGLALLDHKRGVLTDGSGGASSGVRVLQSLVGAGRGGGPSVVAPVALARDPSGVLVMASADSLVRLVDGTPEALPGGDTFKDIRRIRYARSGDLLVLAGRQGDTLGPRLWSLAPSGAVLLRAGSGESGCGTRITENGQTRFGLPLWDPDNAFSASAAELRLTDAADIAVGRDGDLYLADAACHVVYWLRAGSDDLYVVAGDGTDRVATGAGPAGGLFRPALGQPLSLALDLRGNLYIGTGHGLIRRLGTDNWIETIAGTGTLGDAADGEAAIAANFGAIDALLATDDNQLYVDDTRTNARLRRIDTHGRVQTVAGTGSAGYTADGLSAAGAAIGPVAGLVQDGDGRLYFGQDNPPGVRRIASAYVSLPWQDVLSVPGGGGETLEIFDARGRSLRTLDTETGTQLQSVRYDSAGRLAGVTDAHGHETLYERDGAGRIAAIVAHTGQRTTVGYNAFGQPTRIVQPDGALWGLEYDAAGLLTRYTDPNGHATAFEYDSLARLIRDTDAAGGGWRRIEYDLDSDTQQVRYTSGEGRVHRYTAATDTASGVRTAITEAPDGGRTVSISDPLARTSTTTAPDGTRTQTQILPGAVPAGAGADSRTTLTLPSGLTNTTETAQTWGLADPQDPGSRVLTRRVTAINGHPWTTVYDPATRAQTTTSPAGRTTTTERDALDRPVLTRRPGIAATRYRYHDGLLVETRQGEGDAERVTGYAYDTLDHLSSLTDAEGQVTGYTSDALGRVTQLTRPDGQITALSYDAKGNLQGVTPPGRPEHRIDYTPVDLEDDYRPPPIAEATGQIQRSYDKDRALTRQAHALGPQIDYAYDSAGRLLSRTTSAGETRYTYSGNTGRIAAILTPEGEELTYDYDGPLTIDTRWSGTITGHLNTEWNSDLAIAAHTLNDGDRIDYQYDANGLLTRAGDLTLTRDAGNGLLTGTALGGVTTSQTYNAFGELASQTARHDADTPYKTSYTRDRLGRITEQTEILQGQTTIYAYTYDLANRLIEAQENGTVTGRWGYDANGNRTAVNSTANGTYDDQDRLATYDLRTHTRPRPSGEIGYIIDGQDRRIGKTRRGQLVQGFLYKDQLNPIAELDGEGNLAALFVYGERDNVPAYLVKIDPLAADEKTYRILSDHLGSPRVVVEAETGAVAQRIDYDVWGVVINDNNPGFQPFGFAGGLYDPETGLVRFGARDYDPYTGRWMGKDPIGFLGRDYNLYGYVVNDPVNLTDPQGLEVRVYSSNAFGVSGLNHAFVYSTETGRGKGTNGSSGNTLGNGVGDLNSPYKVVPLPPGMSENDFMDNVDAANGWNNGVWTPWVNDCHSDLGNAFDQAGVPYPGAPNGRVNIDDNARNDLNYIFNQLSNPQYLYHGFGGY